MPTTKEGLYEHAKTADIERRSKMTSDAFRRHSGRETARARR